MDAAALGDRDSSSRASARGEGAADPDRAFIEVREKLGAYDSAEEKEQHERQRGYSHTERELYVFEAPVEQAAVGVLQDAHHRVPPFLDFSVAEDEVAEHGRDQQREQKSAQQGESYGPGHGAEQAAFDALQGEDGQIGNDDDDAGEEDGLLHFVCGGSDQLEKSFLPLRKLDVAHDVFHHDHGAVHDHAEIERAERKQIRRNVTEIEKNGGEKKCEGNRDRDDQRAANVPQKNKKDERNQDHAVGEISQNGVRGVVHQVAAVEMGNEFYARRQEFVC